ncbi:hypothetical protein SAMN05421805_1011036 [Saccharopolyspora antimicrobica]|uniref:Uncharacterized protein n=3 Tax=Saccharopolyspora TaxID=1835 RepID=A0A1I4SLC8_9PSEU|nr:MULTISPECIES: hypothetical protein [Saccharopolyspora]RKT87784.1 hypothetical protein ATL45_6205 [Saccharopolyspora antimicrobica]SEG97337.1 hypothetical protein SAMN02982929_06707 [Saccharopolyspora kobensis]SFC80715.1 hypothetical protein SAMN05216506_1011746 [Saccharopolyspora kobensis]SFM65083.1 hypothetical protein SAMN05421805_1011036 [Saccharopolyspora antimicrobica]
MSTEPARSPEASTAQVETRPATSAELPTAPCSVVWSGGHSYVLEGSAGARWAGVDDRGRARFLTDAELRRRGWSRTRA